MINMSEKIDQVAEIIKDAARQLQEEVDKAEDATTTIYESLSDLASSIQNLSNVVISAVNKTFNPGADDDGDKA